MSSTVESIDTCCGGCTGAPAMSIATEPASSTTTATVDPIDIAEGSCEEDCCSSDRGNKDKRVQKDEKDILCSGTCCSGEEEAFSKDGCQDLCCPSSVDNGKDSSKNVSCSGDEEIEGEEICQDDCCTSDDKMAAIGKPRDDGCTVRDEVNNASPCQDGCCGSKVNRTEKQNGGALGCCEGKPAPCCDGRHLALDGTVLCVDSLQPRASNVLLFGNAKATAAKRAEPRIPHAHLTERALFRNMQEN